VKHYFFNNSAPLSSPFDHYFVTGDLKRENTKYCEQVALQREDSGVERELMSGEVVGGGGGGGGGQLWRNQSSPVRANFQQHTREGLAGTPSEGIQPSSGSSKP
jgi:hypothetical protein